MFNKTRTRLTLLNAAVLFVIIACIGAVVYTELRHELYAKVDEALQMRIQQVPQLFFSKTQLSGAVPEEPEPEPVPGAERSAQRTVIQVQGIDPRVFLVLWDDQGNAFPILAGAENRKAVEAFKPFRSVRTPQTVKVDSHAYRVLAIDYDKPLQMNLHILSEIAEAKEPSRLRLPSLDATPTRIVSVQAISIIDSELSMLRKLLELIVFGIFGGGVVTVLAGLYLANKAMRPIRQSWEKQQQFVADASHELRMPLAIIQTNAELVFRHPDRSILDMSEPLSMVLAESKRMGKLTQQLLTLARADSDQEEIVLKPLQLADVIREAAKKFETIAELKQQKLVTELENGLELMGDRERLQQLLVILLDNSLKFTPQHGTVRVKARRSGHHVELVVEDTGQGIAAHELPQIFDRFYRGDKTRNRNGGGTGLGLAIAQWIVARHGGDISAASVPGAGTTMTVRLPAGTGS